MADPTKEKTGGSLTVVVALGANLLVAVAKTIASVLTGSASMVAEAAHSWADFGNEIFLFIAGRCENGTRRIHSATVAKPTSGRCSPLSASSPPVPSCR